MKAKRLLALLVLCAVAVFCCVLTSAFAPVTAAKLILDTPLYSDASFDSELVSEKIQQNETVTLIGDSIYDVNGNRWQKISIFDKEGYVLYNYIYFTKETIDYDVTISKVTATEMGERINVYRSYDENSEIIGTLTDGQKVDVLVDYSISFDYGEFTRIIYEDEVGFVKTVNITTGITYDQKLAIILLSSILGALIVTAIVILVIRKGKMHKKD